MSNPYYGTPQALRASLTDRLRSVAKVHGVQLSDLLRQFAYDRFLARVFAHDPERWVLKGATAMLARLGPESRHTLDVDLYRSAGTLDEAEDALRAASSLDLGDYFRFEVAPGRPLAGPEATRQFTVTAYLGATVFASFPVDLVTDLNMTAQPDVIGPLVDVDIPGITTARYRVYPVVDHIADKVCAIHERHGRQDATPLPSTRYRDLADLSTFARTAVVEAEELAVALRSETERRGLTLPHKVAVPADGGWRAGYLRVARGVPALVDRDIAAAVETVSRFIDPVLDGSAAADGTQVSSRGTRPTVVHRYETLVARPLLRLP
jgi:Nucleotidyl transferase AbiEii toxin, Type IV TA system